MKARTVTCLAMLAASLAFWSTGHAADRVQPMKVERPARQLPAQPYFNPKEFTIDKPVPWQSATTRVVDRRALRR